MGRNGFGIPWWFWILGALSMLPGAAIIMFLGWVILRLMHHFGV